MQVGGWEGLGQGCPGPQLLLTVPLGLLVGLGALHEVALWAPVLDDAFAGDQVSREEWGTG